MFAYTCYICYTMLHCILYHHIISKFQSFLNQLPDTFKKINVKSESKAKVILNDGKKSTCQQYMYEIFNGRSIMDPQLINCLLFFCTQSWSVFQAKHLKKYLYLIINSTQRLRFFIYIYIETANWFSMYLIINQVLLEKHNTC